MRGLAISVAVLPASLLLGAAVVGCSDGSQATANSGAGGQAVSSTANGGAGGAASVGGSGSGAGGSASGGGAANPALPLGTVELMGDCDVPGAAPAGTACQRLSVSCPEVSDGLVELMNFPPAPGTTQRGVVVLGSGGEGTSYYNAQVAMQLTVKGFRVIGRRWDEAWETGPGGMARAACRYATVLTWIHGQPWADGALCMSGNSGGSTEVSYALARYGRGDIVELAVPTAGPPMGRMDHGCLGGAAWEAECALLMPAGVCTRGTVACTYNAANRDLIDMAYPDSPCADQDGAAATKLLADSVAAPGGQFSYPNTRVHFILGEDDCTNAVPLGMPFINAVTSEKDLEVVAAPHGVFSTDAGRAAIIDVIDQSCVELVP